MAATRPDNPVAPSPPFKFLAILQSIPLWNRLSDPKWNKNGIFRGFQCVRNATETTQSKKFRVDKAIGSF